jgi:hypothetical protein
MLSLAEAFAPAEEAVSDMGQRELLEEIAENQRKLLAVIGGLMQAANMHPSIRAMLAASGIAP